MRPRLIELPSPEDVERQMERMRRSARFARANRSFPFLRFLVDGALEGKEFIEEEIAQEVFGVDDEWAPLLDARVRVGRLNLQKYIADYYQNEGAHDLVLIEVPPGTGYRAVYSWNAAALRDNESGLLAELAEMLIYLWPVLAALKDGKG